jgi:hypothetical protein
MQARAVDLTETGCRMVVTRGCQESRGARDGRGRAKIAELQLERRGELWVLLHGRVAMEAGMHCIFQNIVRSRALWLIPVILATQEAAIRRIMVQSQAQANSS